MSILDDNWKKDKFLYSNDDQYGAFFPLDVSRSDLYLKKVDNNVIVETIIGLFKLRQNWKVTGWLVSYEPNKFCDKLSVRLKKIYPDIKITKKVETFALVGSPKSGRIYFDFYFKSKADAAFFILIRDKFLEELKQELINGQ
jgi:hypothetical protein